MLLRPEGLPIGAQDRKHGALGGQRTVLWRSLKEATSSEVLPLLDEEREFWQEELLWDYGDVTAAVATHLGRRAVGGALAQDGSRPLAYCFYMIDVGRAIVGSVFASREQRQRGLEEDLLERVLGETQADPGNQRVECQTLFSTAADMEPRFARAGFVSRARHYLMRPLADAPTPPAPNLRLQPLRRKHLAVAADIIFASHVGTPDAALNLTYATPGHCRAFVDTIVVRDGCGVFDGEASWLAESADGPVGVLITSRVSRRNGHICQVSVVPEQQGRGVGTALMSAALRALRLGGLEVVSLSVTVENEGAYRLYRRLGFSVRKAFGAHAWVRPPDRVRLPGAARPC